MPQRVKIAGKARGGGGICCNFEVRSKSAQDFAHIPLLSMYIGTKSGVSEEHYGKLMDFDLCDQQLVEWAFDDEVSRCIFRRINLGNIFF